MNLPIPAGFSSLDVSQFRVVCSPIRGARCPVRVAYALIGRVVVFTALDYLSSTEAHTEAVIQLICADSRIRWREHEFFNLHTSLSHPHLGEAEQCLVHVRVGGEFWWFGDALRVNSRFLVAYSREYFRASAPRGPLLPVFEMDLHPFHVLCGVWL